MKKKKKANWTSLVIQFCIHIESYHLLALKLKWLFVILLTYGFYMILEPRETHSWTTVHTRFPLFIFCRGSYQFFTEFTHYLFQTENISYFLYILIHRFLSYTKRQPLLSNKYQWSTKLTAPGSSFKEINLIMSAATEMNVPFKNYWLLQLLLYFKKIQG